MKRSCPAPLVFFGGKMNYLKTLAATFAVTLTASAAHAATVNLAGPSNSNLGQSVSCSALSGGCSDFTVTANSAGLLNGKAFVSQSGIGLGVNAPSEDIGFFGGVIEVPDLQPFQLDGFPEPSKESLTFEFDHMVSITSIVLANLNTGFDSDDEFDLFVDGGLYIDNGTTSTISGPIALKSFTIAAVGGDASNDTNGGFSFFTGITLPKFDDFAVKSISYEKISAVPLPASSLLLLAGLGGLAALRRRKS